MEHMNELETNPPNFGGVTLISPGELENLEELFAFEEASPEEDIRWTRCIKDKYFEKGVKLQSYGVLREATLSLPSDSFIIVNVTNHAWFTQCLNEGNGNWAVEIAARMDGVNYVSSLRKSDGAQWTAHEAFVVMKSYARGKRSALRARGEISLW